MIISTIVASFFLDFIGLSMCRQDISEALARAHTLRQRNRPQCNLLHTISLNCYCLPSTFFL
jgi:hypothetical protein